MRLLSAYETAQKTSLSRAGIYRLIREGRFPQARRLSPRRIGWMEAEIDEWILAVAVADSTGVANAL